MTIFRRKLPIGVTGRILRTHAAGSGGTKTESFLTIFILNHQIILMNTRSAIPLENHLFGVGVGRFIRWITKCRTAITAVGFATTTAAGELGHKGACSTVGAASLIINRHDEPFEGGVIGKVRPVVSGGSILVTHTAGTHGAQTEDF